MPAAPSNSIAMGAGSVSVNNAEMLCIPTPYKQSSLDYC
jgi:hypothetical protein